MSKQDEREFKQRSRLVLMASGQSRSRRDMGRKRVARPYNEIIVAPAGLMGTTRRVEFVQHDGFGPVNERFLNPKRNMKGGDLFAVHGHGHASRRGPGGEKEETS